MSDNPKIFSAHMTGADFKAAVTAVKAVATRNRPLYWPHIQLNFTGEGRNANCDAYACSTAQAIRHRAPATLVSEPFSASIDIPRLLPKKDEDVLIVKSEDNLGDFVRVCFPGVILESRVEEARKTPMEMFHATWSKDAKPDVAVDPDYLAETVAGMAVALTPYTRRSEPVHIAITGRKAKDRTKPVQLYAGNTQCVLMPVRATKPRTISD